MSIRILAFRKLYGLCVLNYGYLISSWIYYQKILTFELILFYKMAQPEPNLNNSAFRQMLESEKLTGKNFNDWF